MIWTSSPVPGIQAAAVLSTPSAAAPIRAEAMTMRTSDAATRPPSMPARRRRRKIISSAALNSAAIDVPSASPIYPKTRTSAMFSSALVRTVAMLTITGVRFCPSA